MSKAFSGHYNSLLSDFASKTLPVLLSQRIREDVDVSAVMKDTIEEFDRSLLAEVTRLFEPEEDFSDPRWLEAMTTSLISVAPYALLVPAELETAARFNSASEIFRGNISANSRSCVTFNNEAPTSVHKLRINPSTVRAVL